MSIELPKTIEPRPGEVVQWRSWANRTQHSARAVGGRLYFTDQRLVFCPHAFDAALAGEFWWAPFDEITAVGKEKWSFREIYGGSLRTRLKLTLTDGSEELFFINKLNRVIEDIRQAAGLA